MKKHMSLILLSMSLAACMPASPATPPKDKLATIVAQTLTARPAPFTPIPTLTPASAPAAATSAQLFTSTTAQNVNLRTQPGLLFPVSRVMAQGTRLEVLGFSPGEDWVYVRNEAGVDGWVDLNFVGELPAVGLTYVKPQDSQLVSGRVTSENGSPINGIGFTLTQTTGTKSLRTDAVTNLDGYFYAYLPKSLSGVWTVSYTSIDSTSNAMDSDCLQNKPTCGPTQPASVEVTLPTEVQLIFVWK